MTSRKTFAVLLDEAMARANLTRAALAEKIVSPKTGKPVTRQAVGLWIRGGDEPEHPSPELMGRLLVAVGGLPDERDVLLRAYARETGALPAASVIWAAK